MGKLDRNDILNCIEMEIDTKLQCYFSKDEIDQYVINSDDPIADKYKLLRKMSRKVDFVLHPRIVHESKGLSCPTKYKEGFKKIKDFLQTGNKNIVHSMTKTIGRVEFNDNMLNNDNIYHFHLGSNSDRSDLRLFAYLTDKDAYLIDFYQHKAEMKLSLDRMQKMYANWPELFYTEEGKSNLVNDNIKNIRKKNGVCCLFQLANNTVGHLKISGGTAVSGEAINDIMQTDKFMNRVKRLAELQNTLSSEEFEQAKQELLSFIQR